MFTKIKIVRVTLAAVLIGLASMVTTQDAALAATETSTGPTAVSPTAQLEASGPVDDTIHYVTNGLFWP